MNKFYKWLRKSYNKIISSIAFYPALISIGFLLLSVLMLELDFSEAGKNIKSRSSWISLRDASTARAILEPVCRRIYPTGAGLRPMSSLLLTSDSKNHPK